MTHPQPQPRTPRPHPAPARTPGRWILQANCRDTPDFVDLPAAAARPICAGCPVTRQCHLLGLAEALEHQHLDPSDAHHVYAGQTLAELIDFTRQCEAKAITLITTQTPRDNGIPT